MAGSHNADTESECQITQRRGHRGTRPIGDGDQRNDTELAGVKQGGKPRGVVNQRAPKPSAVANQRTTKQQEDMYTVPKRLEDVPQRLTAKIMARKQEMEELEKESRDSMEKPKASCREAEKGKQKTPQGEIKGEHTGGTEND
ncbi:hypothetical protein BDV36DRAFT_299807 [Aspergillus pseudocaelatus]|uniref:Uncharacterized protein n=1 Tax=Aspergillus pseudocaelatus TaxID=1825620 RepID=A0ABQ6W8Y0_9EURO|nr:hypothetical protein BDV36DRAFT_299807 [Aspergillus pseudocaelatus]